MVKLLHTFTGECRADGRSLVLLSVGMEGRRQGGKARVVSVRTGSVSTAFRVHISKWLRTELFINTHTHTSAFTHTS